MSGLASAAQIRSSFVRWTIVTIPLILFLGSLSGTISGSSAQNSWFRTLHKPGLMPEGWAFGAVWTVLRSEEHTSELQSLMRISYAVFCLKKNKRTHRRQTRQNQQHT